jgi:hypothetical protein
MEKGSATLMQEPPEVRGEGEMKGEISGSESHELQIYEVCELCGRRSSEENQSCGSSHFLQTRTYQPSVIYEDLINQKRKKLKNIQISLNPLTLQPMFSKMLDRVEEDLERCLLNDLKQILSNSDDPLKISTELSPFILTPLMMNASSMGDPKKFYETLTRKKIELSYPEIHGETIHRLVSQSFPIQKCEAEMTINGISVQIHCRADGYWIPTSHEEQGREEKEQGRVKGHGGSYVIELKTLNRIQTLSAKLESWLLQIACYQAAYRETNDAPETLLWVLDAGKTPYQSYLFRVNPENLARAVRSSWTHWFRNHSALLSSRVVSYQRGVKTLSDILRAQQPWKQQQQQQPPISQQRETKVNGFSNLEDDSDDEEEEEVEREEGGAERGADGWEALGDHLNSFQLEAEAGANEGSTDHVTESTEGDDFQVVSNKKNRKEKTVVRKPPGRGQGQKRSAKR